jgi:hypothetical protein
MGWMADGPEFESRYGLDSSLLYVVQTGSGAYPVPYPMDIGSLTPEINRPQSETGHSSPSTAEVKYVDLYIHSPNKPSAKMFSNL